jgi:hypothetical protein
MRNQTTAAARQITPSKIPGVVHIKPAAALVAGSLPLLLVLLVLLGAARPANEPTRQQPQQLIKSVPAIVNRIGPMRFGKTLMARTEVMPLTAYVFEPKAARVVVIITSPRS